MRSLEVREVTGMKVTKARARECRKERAKSDHTFGDNILFLRFFFPSGTL